jgi:GT2 family glycosyltransferase
VPDASAGDHDAEGCLIDATPAISVVVASRNRVHRLAALLQTLRNQDLDVAEFEVVIVDDASSDDTAPLLQRERNTHELQLQVIHNEIRQGAAAARNLGWQAARAPLIAFTDDDCEVAPDWLSTLIEAARSHPGAVLQGRTEPILRERSALAPLSRTKEVVALGPYFETCNIAYPRELLERLSGFDVEAFPTLMGEDTDLAWRAFNEGAGAVFIDQARVYHAVNQLGPMGNLRLALGWSEAMAVFARHPGMRRHLHWGVFWKRSHQLLLGATAGALLARRFPLALFLVVPYLRLLRTRAWGRPWLVPFFAAHDALELYATVRGGIRSRTLVI